ncbi:MAG: hydrogenase maturation nickel metallochaperone HypA [Ignavibacteria bacterium]|nr:hydrogenase maturation nickel metallochaperone HypA [Ignavibacteria bacterium]
MHELSIAQNIIEIVRQNVPENELGDVRAVRMKVGTLAGVVAESLRFSFSVLVADSPLKDAYIQIEHIPFVIQCNTCRQSSSNDQGFAVCPTCGGSDTTVLTGTELQVFEIELDDLHTEAL